MLNAGRVEQLTAMLGQSPRGVGPTIDNRSAWRAVAAAPAFQNVVEEAASLLSKPIPPLDDELYLDFSKTGNRDRCQAVMFRRHGRIATLVLAECMENRGRFLAAMEDAVRAVCSEKTWVLPAHDGGLRNFQGAVVEIDLEAARVAWNLATADYWLGEKLAADARRLIRTELERRTFRPFQGMVTAGEPRMGWLTTTNNWNAVCLAGVTGAALAILESAQRRAFHIAAAEKYVQNLISGFTEDGYCSEGLGYWNYGFGHYVMLSETILQATGGRIDLLDSPKVERVARFGRRMEILPGVYPAFADCGLNPQPDVRLTAFVSRRFGLGLDRVEEQGLLLAAGPSSQLFELGLHSFANSAVSRPAARPAPPPLRDWLPDGGVLICRPRAGAALGAALKGGHNAEHHNHNDLGSFVVALEGQTPLVDPGGEVYTARTFSSKRYDSNVLNSFGHPVPCVAGMLQRTGRSAAARVAAAEFTEETDTLILDVRSAYDVPSLTKLQRKFVFSRQGAGRLTVTDTVEFDSPQRFGVALITFSQWRRLAPNRLLVGEGKGTVQVEFDAGGAAFQIRDQRIEEDLHGGIQPTRLGIDLAEPCRKAVIEAVIAPARP